MSKYISVIYKIFFIGLLLQFFLFNIATFSRGLDAERMKIVRLWKELLLGLLIASTLLLIVLNKQRKQIFPNTFITFLKLLLGLAIGVTLYLNYAIHDLSRGVYALAFKYDFLGFIILFVGFHSSHFIDTQTKNSLIHRYGKVIKICLLGALVWYIIVFIKPGFLKLFGYNNFIFEGTAGGEAPAVYYTHINQGLPRSSFLFERPTTRGFYLTAFFPLFYMLFLHKKPVKNTRAWRSIYGINILLTFSRAARGAWIIELVLLGIIKAGANIKKLKSLFIKGLLPLLFIVGVVGFFGWKQIFAREYSNTGHVAMLKKGIDMSIEKPLTGRGAATAGPGSHRNPEKEGFNPENQFLQIFIEYGIIGFLPRFGIFLSLCLVGVVPMIRKKYSDESGNLLLAMSLGLIGLAASGMILHSFVDRMVVYPFMLLFGIILAQRYANGKKPKLIN